MALPQIVTLSAEGLTGLFPVQTSTGSGSAGDIPALNSEGQIDSTMLPTSGGGSSGVSSFNTRTGAVTLESSDVTTALNYTPVNPAVAQTYTATQTFSGAIIQDYMSPSPNNTPFAQADDFFGDGIISGLTASVPSPGSLTGTLSEGVCYASGQRVYWPGGTYTAIASSQNCFIDMNTDGTLTIDTNTNGLANTLRLYALVTTATAITSITPAAASNVFSAHTTEFRYAPNPNVTYTLSPTGSLFSYYFAQFSGTNSLTIDPTVNGNNDMGIGVNASSSGNGSTKIGICSSPLGGSSGWLALGPYYQGWAMTGLSNNSARPMFNVMNSSQTGYGVGGSSFTVLDTSQVYTLNNVLDDGLGNISVAGTILTHSSVSSGSTAGDVTASASDILSNYFVVTATQTAAFTVTTDTAANILSPVSGAAPIGSSFRLRLINNDQSATGYAMTLAGGTGVTISTTLPNPAVPKGAWADYLFIFTDVTGGSVAVTVTYVGQGTL